MDKKKVVNLVVKDLTFTQSAENADVVIIAGYANKYLADGGGVLIDHSQESVLPSSYDLSTFKKNPIILYNHSTYDPVGKAINIDIKPEGLYIEAEIHKQMDEKVFYGVKNGILKTLSIGFNFKDGKYVNDVFYYTDLELFEISIVAVPDNNEAIFGVLTTSPCANGGSCLLASVPTNKKDLGTVYTKSAELNVGAWKDTDKTELKKALIAINDQALLSDAFLIYDEKNTELCKFPHHILTDKGLQVSQEGLASAMSALNSLQEDSPYSKEVQKGAWEHLQKHYSELKDVEMPDIILSNLERFKDNEQIDPNTTINTTTGDTSAQNPQTDGGEKKENKPDLLDKEVLLNTLEELKGSPEGLDTLLEVYAKVEDVLNSTLLNE